VKSLPVAPVRLKIVVLPGVAPRASAADVRRQNRLEEVELLRPDAVFEAHLRAQDQPGIARMPGEQAGPVRISVLAKFVQ
jgi:hypothetical protein